MNDANGHDEKETAHDALASLIQAAGRRADPPGGDFETIRAAARDAWQAKLRQQRHRSRRRHLALAASVIVLIGLAAWVVRLESPDARIVATVAVVTGDVMVRPSGAEEWTLAAEGASLDARDRLRVEGGGGAALRLNDGDSLRILTGTELVLESSRRIELVRGTVYVDSGEFSIGSPVEVVTVHGVVRDIGTQFEVRDAGDRLRVRVRSGRIELTGSAMGDPVEALAGDELEVTENGALERRAVAPDAEDWGWAAALAPPMGGGGTVSDYLSWIARETGKSLEYPETGTALRVELMRWRGDVRGLMPLELLDAVAATAELSYELTADGAIVIRER